MGTNRITLLVLFLFSTIGTAENLGRRPITAQDILDDPSAILEIDEPDISQLPPLGDPGGGKNNPPPPTTLGRTLGKNPHISESNQGLGQNSKVLNLSNEGVADPKQNESSNDKTVNLVNPLDSAKQNPPILAIPLPKSEGNSMPPPVATAGSTVPLVLAPQFLGSQAPRIPTDEKGATHSPIAPKGQIGGQGVASENALENTEIPNVGASLAQPAAPLLALPAIPIGVTEKLQIPPSTAMPPLPGVPDVAVILVQNQFYPSRIKLKDGLQTRLIFTTTNKKPAALIIERLQIQRWIAKEPELNAPKDNDRMKWEATREVAANRITEIVVEPKSGTYAFHDAITGAAGELLVE